MKKISLLTVIMSIFGVTYVYAAEGHSHELPEFLHFMEELIEEHSVPVSYTHLTLPTNREV